MNHILGILVNGRVLAIRLIKFSTTVGTCMLVGAIWLRIADFMMYMLQEELKKPKEE